MKKLIYMGMGLLLCMSFSLWTGCDKPNELDPETGGGSGGDTTEDVRDTTEDVRDTIESVFGHIEGVVTDNATGESLSMATVELWPMDLQTQTDGSGAFSFDSLEAGTYRLRVSKDGYVSSENGIRVNAGQTVSRTVPLAKERAEMQLLDMDGNALSELYLEWVFGGVFQLRNSGHVVVEWKISEVSEAWLECGKQSGELAPGASERIELTVDRSKLPSEENEAVVSIASTAGEMQLKVRVKVFVPGAVGPDYEETAFGMSLRMVAVQGGMFQMGATKEQGRNTYDAEKPVHAVALDGFYIGKYEVTQGQWKAVMGTNPSSFKGDDRPVEKVSWNDAVSFCEKLSEMTGRKYRLPTEAEWEYAARGGQQADGTMYAGSGAIYDVAVFGYGINSGATFSVGSKKPNGLGLYDMSGNVWEWCSDWYDSEYYSESPSVNPQGPSGGSSRVIRGGGWSYDARNCRVSFRGSDTPGYRDRALGFRVVCER